MEKNLPSKSSHLKNKLGGSVFPLSTIKSYLLCLITLTIVLVSTSFKVQANADLTSVTVFTANQTTTYGTAGTIQFTVSVSRSNSGNNQTASFTTSTLPNGVTAAFSRPSDSNPFSFGNGSGSLSTISNITLTLTTNSTAKPGTYSFTVSATSNNTFTSSNVTFTINPKTLTITGVNKAYDGTTSATTSGISGVINSDVVSLTGVPTFVDKNIGTAKTISGLSLTGANASNYVLPVITANITAKPLTYSIA